MDQENNFLKTEHFEVIMPMNCSTNDVFNHIKFKVRMLSPDEDDIRLVILKSKVAEPDRSPEELKSKKIK